MFDTVVLIYIYIYTHFSFAHDESSQSYFIAVQTRYPAPPYLGSSDHHYESDHDDPQTWVEWVDLMPQTIASESLKP